MFAGSNIAFTGFFFSGNNYGTVATEKESQGALFSIASNKAPGSNGFSSHFFKKAWSVVRSDVLKLLRIFSLLASYWER